MKNLLDDNDERIGDSTISFSKEELQRILDRIPDDALITIESDGEPLYLYYW